MFLIFNYVFRLVLPGIFAKTVFLAQFYWSCQNIYGWRGLVALMHDEMIMNFCRLQIKSAKWWLLSISWLIWREMGHDYDVFWCWTFFFLKKDKILNWRLQIIIFKFQLHGLRRLMQGGPDHPKAPLGNNFRPPQPLLHRPVRTNIDFRSKTNGKACPTMYKDVHYKG